MPAYTLKIPNPPSFRGRFFEMLNASRTRFLISSFIPHLSSTKRTLPVSGLLRLLRVVRAGRLYSEIVGAHHFGFDAEVVEHVLDAFEHDGRPAEVVFDFGGIGVLVEVFAEHDLMDEAGRTGPLVVGQRIAERNVQREVRELPFQFLEFLNVEEFSC